MNLWSSGTSTWASSLAFDLSWPWLFWSFFGKTSAIATSLVGPLVVESAFSAAPVPRPPQPTSARLIVLLSPAYIRGSARLATAAAAAILPVVLRSSRRDRFSFTESLMEITSTRRVIGIGRQGGKAGEKPQESL